MADSEDIPSHPPAERQASLLSREIRGGVGELRYAAGLRVREIFPGVDHTAAPQALATPATAVLLAPAPLEDSGNDEEDWRLQAIRTWEWEGGRVGP